MEEKLVSTVHTFVGKMPSTLRSWWRRGRDDHLDAAGVVVGRLLAALELSSEAAAAAVVRRRRSCPLCHRQRRRRPNLLRSSAKTTAKARAWWRPCPHVVWYGRPGAARCGGGRRIAAAPAAGREREGRSVGREGLLVSPTGGPRGDKGMRRGHPRASVSPQTERNFGPGMDRKRTDSGHLSV